ncbi:MAG: cobalamin-binding protein [Chlorobiaceae bacterium]|nr:cobalamin-binding protein [Chlorobiaceae bacterium]
MSETSEPSLFAALSDAVLNMDEDAARENAIRVIRERIDAYRAIEHGLVDGMNRAGQLFEDEEYFIPEILLCSDAMYAGLDILDPHIDRSRQRLRRKVVIGVVEGDTHDIGKNLVKTLLDAAGFEVVDLGRDIPPARIVDTAINEQADVIALSTLMTTTMDGMSEVIELLKAAGRRDALKVIVGGGPVSQAFADRIGADGYAPTAPAAVKLLQRLFEESAHA